MSVLTASEVASRRQRGIALQEKRDADGAKVRVALLGSFTLQPMIPFLCEALDRLGLRAEVHTGKYGQIAEEILNRSSWLYEMRPDFVVVLPDAEDWLAPLYQEPYALTAEDGPVLLDNRIRELKRLVESLLEYLPAACCLPITFGSEIPPVPYVLSPDAPQRGQAWIEGWFQGVRSLARLAQQIVVVDWDWHSRGTGQQLYRDDRLWYLARMPLNPTGFAALSDLTASHIAACKGLARKVAVMDLDDTLWGGTVGEVGAGGVTIGEEGIGLAFKDFQRELLKLRSLGILLAVCSKNDPEYTWEVFERNPSMLIKREHLAAVRINWKDKATNLQEIAEELNLGLDSFVYFDDSPIERAWISQALPQVLVPEMPTDPVERPRFVKSLACFNRLEVTELDARRSESYRAEALRREFRTQKSSINEFLDSLAQEVDIRLLDEISLPRAAQMCQRTNQFNLTTQRYMMADLKRLMQDPAAELYTLAVRDRFSDSGITGLAVLLFRGAKSEIDTLLLSCRVLGRRIEDAFLSYLAERARHRGAQVLVGRYIPSGKNMQAASFYSSRGFTDAGESTFELSLETGVLPWPTEVRLKES